MCIRDRVTVGTSLRVTPRHIESKNGARVELTVDIDVYKRQMYSDLCSRVVRVREIEDVLQGVAGLREGERQREQAVEQAAERLREENQEMCIRDRLLVAHHRQGVAHHHHDLLAVVEAIDHLAHGRHHQLDHFVLDAGEVLDRAADGLDHLLGLVQHRRLAALFVPALAFGLERRLGAADDFVGPRPRLRQQLLGVGP